MSKNEWDRDHLAVHCTPNQSARPRVISKVSVADFTVQEVSSQKLVKGDTGVELRRLSAGADNSI
jgi:hypothetical protein